MKTSFIPDVIILTPANATMYHTRKTYK